MTIQPHESDSALTNVIRARLTHSLKSLGVKPNRALGQHFLCNHQAMEKIVAVAHISEIDHILEIGPGFGDLTDLLLATGAWITTIEFDKILAAYLQRKYPTNERLTLITDDAVRYLRKLETGEILLQSPFKIVSNLPYQITSPVIRSAITLGPLVPEMVLTIQRDVAERLSAPPGTSQRGILSVLLELNHSIEIVSYLSPKNFLPPPKVESAIVRIQRTNAVNHSIQPEAFMKLLGKCFQSKRKMIRNSLTGITPKLHNSSAVSRMLEQLQINPMCRPEELQLQQFIAIFLFLEDDKKRVEAE